MELRGARRLAAQAASPLLGIVLLLAGMGVIGVFVGQAIASVGYALALWSFVRRHPPATPADPGPAPDFRPLLRLWTLFVASSVIQQVVERRLEVVFLERYSGPAQIASYSVAFNVVTIAFSFCSSVTGATVPSIAAASAAGDSAKVEAAFNRALRILALVGALFTAGLVAVGPALVTVFYGAAFSEAASLVPWLALSLLLAPLGHYAPRSGPVRRGCVPCSPSVPWPSRWTWWPRCSWCPTTPHVEPWRPTSSGSAAGPSWCSCTPCGGCPRCTCARPGCWVDW